MAAKPGDLPVWATDANYPAGAEPEAGTPTKVEPISGKQALGFRPAEKPPAQGLNWFQNLVYLWILYLSEGELEGDHTIDGDLYVTEPVVHPIPASCARRDDEDDTHPKYENGKWTVSTSIDPIVYPVPAKVGDQIASWAVYAQKASASGTITAVLVKIDADDGGVTPVSTSTDGTNAPGNIQLGEGGLDEDVAAGTYYEIHVNGGGTGGDFFIGAEVELSHPPPP